MSPSAAAVFLQDLSELRRAERTLTRREALFEALERQAGEWATVLDADGVMLYVCCATFGVSGVVSLLVSVGSGR